MYFDAILACEYSLMLSQYVSTLVEHQCHVLWNNPKEYFTEVTVSVYCDAVPFWEYPSEVSMYEVLSVYSSEVCIGVLCFYLSMSILMRCASVYCDSVPVWVFLWHITIISIHILWYYPGMSIVAY